MESDNTPVRDQKIGKEWVEGSQDIEWNQICFVRAINDPRQIKIETNNGKNYTHLISVEDSSKGEYDTATIHWSINHKVAGHMWGDWSAPRFVFVSPSENLIKENGIPDNLKAVDTFWSKEIVIPKESKILSIGNNQELENKDPDGVEIIKSCVTDEEMNKLSKLYQIHLGDVVDFQKEGNYRLHKKVIDEKITKEINEIISDMGYSILDEDHGGVYMGNKNLDYAVYRLGVRVGIKHSTLHAYTLSCKMVDLLGEKGLLETISNYKFEPLSPDHKNTDFSSLIDGVERVFTDYHFESKGDVEILLRFSAQLYNAILTYPKITSESKNSSALTRLFRAQPTILENINVWASNDKNRGNIVKERIYKTASV